MHELIDSILAWWEKHQYDTKQYPGEDERMIYYEEPEFVTIAKRLKEEQS